jgi:hypothetical protein
MQKYFILGSVCLATLTSPVWFFVLRNEAAAFQLKAELGSASLPEGAKILSSFSRVYNSGNSDGCDYEAFAVIEYYGRAAALQSSYIDLLSTMSDAELHIGQNVNAAHWSAKLVGLSTELSISPNSDHARRYLVSVGKYPRNMSPDFRCW